MAPDQLSKQQLDALIFTSEAILLISKTFVEMVQRIHWAIDAFGRKSVWFTLLLKTFLNDAELQK